eukprot:scaffold34863_cov67-Isochrysis_galbana.AAC.1
MTMQIQFQYDVEQVSQPSENKGKGGVTDKRTQIPTLQDSPVMSHANWKGSARWAAVMAAPAAKQTWWATVSAPPSTCRGRNGG